MGCAWALTELSDSYHIAFLSESQAAIQALNNPQVHSGLVMDTITQLNKLGTKHKVELRWIRTDELATRWTRTLPSTSWQLHHQGDSNTLVQLTS
jgi:hypothetical protein